MQDYQLLKNKLAELKAKDPNYKIFGSDGHHYELEPTLSEQEIQNLEKHTQITFPEEYRQFLLEVGSSGAGPDYGLYPLEENLHEQLNLPFSHPQTYQEVLKIEEKALEEFPDDFPADHAKMLYTNAPGMLTLGTAGSAFDYGLIITGEERGQVFLSVDPGWVPVIKNRDDVLNEHGQLAKLNLNSANKNWEKYYTLLYADQNRHLRLGFYDWYNNWLDKSLNSFNKKI